MYIISGIVVMRNCSSIIDSSTTLQSGGAMQIIGGTVRVANSTILRSTGRSGGGVFERCRRRRDAGHRRQPPGAV